MHEGIHKQDYHLASLLIWSWQEWKAETFIDTDGVENFLNKIEYVQVNLHVSQMLWVTEMKFWPSLLYIAKGM